MTLFNWNRLKLPSASPKSWRMADGIFGNWIWPIDANWVCSTTIKGIGWRARAWRFPHEKQKVWEWRWRLEAAISMPVKHIPCSPTHLCKSQSLKFRTFLMELQLPSINLHSRLLLLLLPLIFQLFSRVRSNASALGIDRNWGLFLIFVFSYRRIQILEFVEPSDSLVLEISTDIWFVAWNEGLFDLGFLLWDRGLGFLADRDHHPLLVNSYIGSGAEEFWLLGLYVLP